MESIYRLLDAFTTRVYRPFRLDIIEQDVRQRPSITLKGLLAQLWSNRRFRNLIMLGWLLEMVMMGINMVLPVTVGTLTEAMIDSGGLPEVGELLDIGLLAAGLMGFGAIINIAGVRRLVEAMAIAETQARRNLSWWTMGHSAGWFQSREAGQIASRISEAALALDIVLTIFSFHLMPTLGGILATAILLFVIDPIAGGAFVVWMALFLGFSCFGGILSQRFAMRFIESRVTTAGHITDIVINHSLVRLFSARDREEARVAANSDKVNRHISLFTTLLQIVNFSRDMLLILLALSMIALLGHGLLDGRVSPAGFVSGMSSVFILITMGRAFYHGLREMLLEGARIQEALQKLAVPHDLDDPDIKAEGTALKGSIKFENVDFAYPQGRKIFNNLILDIPAGQKVALVGPSGSGKTTLMAILQRFADVDQGRIRLGGKDIREIPFADLRRTMVQIPQDTSMLHRTVMDNIRYARPDARDDEVITAAKKASAHNFILELPEGYDTLVGERGVRLSGGQRQRIAIARAILADTPVLLMDEATSALDSESEILVQKGLAKAMEGRTVIAIAHRLSTISRLDHILVMEEGRIIEDGSHDALLRRDGLYARLWAMQSGGFIPELEDEDMAAE